LVRDWLGEAPARAPRPDVHAAEPRREPSPFEPRREPTPPEPFDLPTFAATVRALAANSSHQDRFHDNKVFIAALWRASQQEPNFPRISLPEFKQRLVEANSHNLLHLSRADLVSAMDPQLVAESETAHLNATFHFVLLEADHTEPRTSLHTTHHAPRTTHGSTELAEVHSPLTEPEADIL